jgi:hypothetical protein
VIGILTVGEPGVSYMPEYGMGALNDERESLIIRVGRNHWPQVLHLQAGQEARTDRTDGLALTSDDCREGIRFGIWKRKALHRVGIPRIVVSVEGEDIVKKGLRISRNWCSRHGAVRRRLHQKHANHQGQRENGDERDVLSRKGIHREDER